MGSRFVQQSLTLLLLVLLPFSVAAQSPAPTAPPPAAPAEELLKPEQLDAIVAPLALYPDNLLAQILIASTYPLEVVQAERWATEHKDLQGDALKKAIEQLTWDDSVKSLLATPSVLTMMSTKLDWTQKMGDAVLAQQPDVMDAIQRLRTRAQATDKLKSTKEQIVTVRHDGGRQIIAIEPTDPQNIHVPYYDPAVVFGAWPNPEYPPYYYYPDDYYLPGGIIATGVVFGAAYAIWRWANWDRFWGGRVDWNARNIGINRNGRVEHWRHNPTHRRGVAYNNSAVRQQFAGSAGRPGDRAKAGQLPAGGKKTGDRAKQAGQAKRPTQGGKSAQGKAAQGKKTAQGKGKQAKKSAQAKRSGQSKKASQARRSPQQHARRNPPQRSVARVQRHSVSQQRSFGGGGRSYGGGGRSFGGGGRGFGGGGGRGGGGRRSDIRVKHDIAFLGRLDNGLGWYRFAYTGGTKVYVGVMAQEVHQIDPTAVMRGRDGYLRVDYEKLGLKFQTYDAWIAGGGRLPGASESVAASSAW
jgi:hypothetical protein